MGTMTAIWHFSSSNVTTVKKTTVALVFAVNIMQLFMQYLKHAVQKFSDILW